jgi:hypothetical protein
MLTSDHYSSSWSLLQGPQISKKGESMKKRKQFVSSSRFYLRELSGRRALEIKIERMWEGFRSSRQTSIQGLKGRLKGNQNAGGIWELLVHYWHKPACWEGLRGSNGFDPELLACQMTEYAIDNAGIGNERDDFHRPPETALWDVSVSQK